MNCMMYMYVRMYTGVFAVRAGPPLYENICRYLLKQELQEWYVQLFVFTRNQHCSDEF
jgi:hypothetical protein